MRSGPHQRKYLCHSIRHQSIRRRNSPSNSHFQPSSYLPHHRKFSLSSGGVFSLSLKLVGTKGTSPKSKRITYHLYSCVPLTSPSTAGTTKSTYALHQEGCEVFKINLINFRHHRTACGSSGGHLCTGGK